MELHCKRCRRECALCCGCCKAFWEGNKCCRVFVFIVNFLAIFFGVAFIVIGVIWVIQEKRFGDKLPQPPISLGMMSLNIGLLVIIIAVFGCYAAISKSVYFIISNAFLLFFLSIKEFILGLFVLIVQAEHYFLRNMETVMYKTFKKNISSTRRYFSKLEMEYDCCGVKGPIDYAGSLIPASCCDNEECECTYPFPIGCAEAVKLAIEADYSLNGKIFISFSILALIGAIFGCCWTKRIKRPFDDEIDD